VMTAAALRSLSTALLLALAASFTGCGGVSPLPSRTGGAVMAGSQQIPGRQLWTKRGVSAPGAISPDGRWVCAAGEKGGIVVIPASAPAASFLVSPQSVACLPVFLEWAPDSRRVAATQLTSLEVYDVSARKRSWAVTSLYLGTWSPDGRQLGASVLNAERCQVVDAGTGTTVHALDGIWFLLWSPRGRLALARGSTLFGKDRLHLLNATNWQRQVSVTPDVDNVHAYALVPR
jgi:hypothetical protein